MPRRDAAAGAENYYRRISQALMTQIERGTAPWTQAWEPDKQSLPYNVKTGKTYRGGNMLWLQSQGTKRQYADERWGTYKQIKSIGGQVRRGEKGCSIVFWQGETKKLAREKDGRPMLDKNGLPVYEKRRLRSPRVFRYTVFNAEQCDGLPPRPRRSGTQQWDTHEGAEQVLKDCGAIIEHTAEGKATYDLARDRIVMPFREQYKSGPGFYQSMLHELGHWTGHPSRLDRKMLVRGMERGMGSAEYAREELRAEISSMITGDRLNIGHDPARHASYCDAWVKNLDEDPLELQRAARDAQRMSDFLLDRDRHRSTDWEARRAAAPSRADAELGPLFEPRQPERPRRSVITVPRRSPALPLWGGRNRSRGRSSGPAR